MSTITTINSGDSITNSRADINQNFANLNSDKIETSVLDTDTTLANNSDSKIATQKAVKAYVDAGGNVNASTTAKGIVEEATFAEANAKTGAGGTGARLFVSPENMPLPFSINMYKGGASAGSILRYSDKLGTVSSSGNPIFANIDGTISKYLTTTSLLAGTDSVESAVVLGDYIYLLLTENSTTPDTKAVYRVNLSDLSTNSAMTFSGAVTLTNANTAIEMTSDGTYFYFSFQAGASANSYDIAKYSISGTTFTYIETITLGNTAILEFVVMEDGTFRAHTTTGTNTELQKYGTTGTSTATYSGFFVDGGDELMNIRNTIYVVDSSVQIGAKVYLP